MTYQHTKRGWRGALSTVLCVLLVMTSLPLVMFGTAPKAAAQGTYSVRVLAECTNAGTVRAGDYTRAIRVTYKDSDGTGNATVVEAVNSSDFFTEGETRDQTYQWPGYPTHVYMKATQKPSFSTDRLTVRIRIWVNGVQVFDQEGSQENNKTSDKNFSYDWDVPLNYYYIDLNSYIDGAAAGATSPAGAAAVTVNGEYKGNVADYYAAHLNGSTYSVTAYANNGYSVSGSQTITGTVNGGNVDVRPSFTTNSYSISYDLAGGSVSGNPTSYNINTAPVQLNAPTRFGYTFKGWTGSNGSTPSTDVATPNVISTGLSGYTKSNPYTASGRDHFFGNDFNVVSGTTYRVFVTAKRTAGSLGMNGGIWYTAQTAGEPYDGVGGAFTLLADAGDGWGVYYKDVTVPGGKQKGRFYIQMEQWDSNATTTWLLANCFVTSVYQPLAVNLGNYTTSSPYTCNIRDHIIGASVPVTVGQTYRVYVTARRTAGSLGLNGGLWYYDNTAGSPWDSVGGAFNLMYDMGDGWGRYYKDVTVPAGKVHAHAYFQIEQSHSGAEGNVWQVGDIAIVYPAFTNLHYTANWEITSYNISYNLNGGSVSGNPNSYTIESSPVRLNNPTRTGYTFTGWTGSGITSPSTDVSVPNGMSSGLSAYTVSNPCTCSGRDHILGNAFKLIAGATYRILVTAKRTAGSLNMQGGIWYTSQTLGEPYDNYGVAFTYLRDAGDGWGVYYRDVTVPSGKQAGKFYIQLDQAGSGGGTTWQIANMAATMLFEPFDLGLDGYTTSNPWVCGSRDHFTGNVFSVTPGTTYRVLVTAKQTAGSLPMNGGIWYTSQTSGAAYDGVGGSFTYLGDAGNGWGRYYKDVTVPAGKQAGRIYIQMEQWDSSATTTWQIAYPDVIYPAVTDLTYTANWKVNQYSVTYENGTATGGALPAAQTADYGSTIALATNAMTKNETTDATYTVTYNYGNGSASTTANTYLQRTYTANGWTRTAGSQAQDYANGAIYTVPANGLTLYPCFTQGNRRTSTTLPSPTRDGYTFTGWFDGETRVGGAGESFTPTASVTLTAGWTANEYTVTLDQQGATTEGTLSVTATYDAAMPAITVPQRTGYGFGGYFSEPNGAGTVYYDGNGASANNWNIAADTTLYAFWVANPYYLHFEANGGNSGEMSNQKLTYDVEANITANAFGKTATVTYDYKGGVEDKTTETVTLGFANWATNSNGTGTTYSDGQPVINLASEKDAVVFLYAQWNGVNVTLPATSRVGYDFAGWYVGETPVNGEYTVTGDTLITARWTAHTYTVAFDGNQGAGATPVTGETASVTFTYDGDSNVLTSNGFGREGYEFLGWSLDSNATAATYINGQPVDDNLTAEDGATVTLYAVWNALEQTNNYSGATVGGASTFTGYTDSTVTLGSADDKTGYTFGGWYNTSDLTGDPVTSVLVPAGGATVFAKWTANGYNVTLNVGNEGLEYITPGTTNVTATYDAAMPEITLPTRTGYSFGGFADVNGALYYTADGSSAKNYDVAGDLTLYAVWTPDEDTACTVKHLKQDLNADTYTLADTDALTGTSDTTVTAEVRSYTGFTAPAEQTVFIKPDGSAVLEYRYTRNSYTLTVVPAGDSFDGETSVTRQYEDTYAITAVPDKTGYIFNGWTKTAGEGSLVGNTYTFGAGDGTVTAAYTPKAYTVRFNSNNGEDLTREQTLVYDKSAPLDRNSFSKSVTVSFAYNGGTGSPEQMTLGAFTFTGWNTAPDGSGEGYGDGEVVVNLSTGADVELYAQWTTTTIDMPETSRTGYDLDGWYEGENKVEGAYTVTCDVSFAARWTAHTYTVAFDANQGAGATPVTGSTASADFTYDAADNALTANGFARAGYDFLGWSTDPAATAADYTDSQTVADGLYAGKGATVTLYAVWQALEQTNNYDGATSGGAVTFTGETDSTVTLGAPDAKTGYTFGGWFRNAELTDGPVTEIVVPAGGARVYAKWTANRYAVTLDVGDEGLAYITPGTTDVTATYDADMPAITAPTRVGYQFAGYYTDDGVMYYDADGNSARTWDIDGETSLTARWIPDGDTKYKVEHYLEDLNADTYTLETYGIFGGESDSEVTPAVGGFSGFTAPAAQTVRIEPDGSTVVKYYYTRNSYTVKFLNYDGALLSEKVYEYGDTVAEPATPTKPSDSTYHYYFSRWNPAVITVDGDITYKAEFTAHAHEWKSEVTVKPDGKNRGVRTYTCEDCGSSYREVIKSQFEDCPWCGQDHSGHGWIGEINWIFHMIFAMVRDIFNFASRG